MSSERWYKEGLRFGCRQCGKCCGGAPGYVWVNDDDIIAMAAELGITKYDFEMSFVRIVRGRKMSLNERENGDCVLLSPKTRKCMVYESRPIQCRTWPFWDYNVKEPKNWKQISKTCPGCYNPQGKLYTLEEIEKERAKF